MRKNFLLCLILLGLPQVSWSQNQYHYEIKTYQAYFKNGPRSGDLPIVVQYPVLKSKTKNTVLERVNKQIENRLLKVGCETVDEFSEHNVRTTVHFLNEKFLSFSSYDLYICKGMPRLTESIESFLFDLQTGERIDANSLLQDEKGLRAIVEKTFFENLMRKIKNDSDWTKEDQKFCWDGKTDLSKDLTLYLLQGSIGFTNLYASHIYSPCEDDVILPFKRIKKFFKKNTKVYRFLMQ